MWPDAADGPLELWAGPERESEWFLYSDVLPSSAEQARALADLGVARVRYELHREPRPRQRAGHGLRTEREHLAALRAAGLALVLGIPATGDVLDAGYPRLLAEDAAQAARDRPWADAWTPMLPRRQAERPASVRRACGEALATREAMRAIREEIPDAKLVSAAAAAPVAGADALAGDIALANEVRWLPWDLLCGRFTSAHPLWQHALSEGVDPADLRALADDPCVPDLLGVEYELLSERYLDEDGVECEECRDAGLAQVREYALAHMDYPPLHGIGAVLREAWERYGLPLAVTGTRLAGSREDQLRWLAELRRDAERLRDEGIAVVAVGLGPAFGALSEPDDPGFARYTPGALDLRSGPARPTALAGMAAAMAHGERYEHPVLDTPGWWWRPERVWHHTDDMPHGFALLPEAGPPPSSRPLLVTAADSALATAFGLACERRGIAYRLVPTGSVDLEDPWAVAKLLAREQPWAVVNAAAYASVDDAERDAERCVEVNAERVAALANQCAGARVQLAAFSSDLVFDGRAHTPYTESSEPSPLNVFGRSKLLMEALLRMLMPDALVIRSGPLFGAPDEQDFLSLALRAFACSERFLAADDVVVSPTYVPDLVEATLDLLIDRERGIWHLANEGQTTWAEFVRSGARAAGVRPTWLGAMPHEELGWRAQRPRYSALGSEHGRVMPSLENALARFAAEVELREPALSR